MIKYSILNNEGSFSSKSNDDVLKNKLNISSIDEINDIELVLLDDLYQHIFENDFPTEKITVKLIKSWHYQWLGNVYDWAGKERVVNISKDKFMFAPANRLNNLLNQLDNNFLSKYTPCFNMNREQLINSIAIIHIELILIHPFRDGNGRLSRLLADVMAVQGGLSPLNYEIWMANQRHYVSAIHSGLNLDYQPMKYWVEQALK